MRRPGTDLKQFRSDVAALKKAGLIPATNKSGKSVNVKSARPGQLVQGKRLIDYVRDRDNQDVLKGDAVVIPKSKVSDTQGFKIKKPTGGTEKVIVPVSKDAKVSIKKGNIVVTHQTKSGGKITRTMLPRKDLQQYLNDAESLPELKGGDWYSFYFYGNKSSHRFRNAEDLVEFLTKYDAVKDDSRVRDVFRNLEIVHLDRKASTEWDKDVVESTRKRRQGGRRRPERRRIANVPAWKRPLVRAKRREAAREYRAKKDH